MDIQTLRQVFTSEAWQALRQYFIREALSESESKFRKASPSPTVNRAANPVPALLNPVKPPRPGYGSKPGRSIKFPPPFDASSLAYSPPQIAKAKWKNETAIGLRRNLIGEALKKAAPAGVTEEEICEHLLAARFPVEDDYYEEIVSGKPRIYDSIYNDLALFRKLGWVQKSGRGPWKWVRSKL